MVNSDVDCYRSCEAMGTRFEVFLRGEDREHLEAVAVAVLEEIVRLDGLLSRFDPRSEIARINREAYWKPVRTDREIFALLERCDEARRLTEGYFNVMLGDTLILDAESHSVSFDKSDAAIDLGGVGKGYALDCGREIMRRFNVANGLLQGGTSSVMAVGGDSWLIDIRRPLSNEVAERCELIDCTFSCSSVRHVWQKISDLVNPLNAEPLTGDAACVVLAMSATEAEILSTALLTMGRERAISFLNRKDVTDVRVGWVDSDSCFFWMLA